MTIRIGIIGLGRIGEGHMKKLFDSPDGQVVAVSDANIKLAEEMAQKYSLRHEIDAHSMIKSSDIDAVVIASWDKSHAEYAVSAINAGKYAYCEKPLGTSVEECREVMNAEINAGKRLLEVGFMRRHDKPFKQLKHVMDSGKMGDVLMVRCFHINKFPGGEPYTTKNLLRRMLVHEFDAIHWLLGQEFSTAQIIPTRSTKYANGEYEDPQLIMLTTDKGVSAYIVASTNGRYGYDIRCEITAEEGVVNLPEPMGVFSRYGGVAGNEFIPEFRERFEDAFRTSLLSWAKCVNAGGPKGPSAWDGYRASAVVDACEEAREKNAVVQVRLDECPSFYL